MNIAEILKTKPKGFPLYSSVIGECKLVNVDKDNEIIVATNSASLRFNYNGSFYIHAQKNYNRDGECVLFPSKDNRDWSNIGKFDVTTLKPFDKVLVRDDNQHRWVINLFGSYRDTHSYKFDCITNSYKQCIPYNEETSHLVGTTDNCPNYYKTW